MLIYIAVLLIIAVFFLFVMAADCNRFVIREYHCTSEKLKRSGTILMLSDLHNKSYGKDNSRLLQAVSKLQPDLILLAGDMYTAVTVNPEGSAACPDERMLEKSRKLREKNGRVAALIGKLAERYPVYYGMGNHEQKTKLFPEEYGNVYEAFLKQIGETGAVVLANEKVQLPGYPITLYGLEIDRTFYQRFQLQKMDGAYLEGLLGKPDPNSMNVLIAHNPDYFEAYAEWGADLVVSGHVHGGLMRLPFLGGVISPRLQLFPHYDGGLYRQGKSTLVLGRGLGTHTLPVRIFNPGELVVIRLTGNK